MYLSRLFRLGTQFNQLNQSLRPALRAINHSGIMRNGKTVEVRFDLIEMGDAIEKARQYHKKAGLPFTEPARDKAIVHYLRDYVFDVELLAKGDIGPLQKGRIKHIEGEIEEVHGKLKAAVGEEELMLLNRLQELIFEKSELQKGTQIPYF